MPCCGRPFQYKRPTVTTLAHRVKLFDSMEERVNLAAKIVECNELEQKASKSNRWFQDAAGQAGLDLNDDMIDKGLARGVPRDNQLKLRETRAARGRLMQLLAQPMQTQRFEKFLSSNSARRGSGSGGVCCAIVNDKS